MPSEVVQARNESIEVFGRTTSKDSLKRGLVGRSLSKEKKNVVAEDREIDSQIQTTTLSDVGFFKMDSGYYDGEKSPV